MKVLLCVREDYIRNFAGDSMQILKTEQYLTKRGVKVEINSGHITDFTSYDLVHLFNINSTGEMYKYYKLAHRIKNNIVITPSYWNMTKYYESDNDLESIKLWNKCNLYRQEILRGCKKIFACSNTERELLEKDFNVGCGCEVIYSGIEVENEDIPLYNFKDRYKLDNYVLSVGRIAHKKNQLSLSKACSELGITLVLIGNIDDKDYFDKCMSYKNTIYLGFMDSYNIYNAYRFAKTHILPGFVEMPGLSSLEAAAIGCNIVSTSEGCGMEYFKDKALYCNPYDYPSIVKAVENSYKKPKSDRLKRFVLKNYNWENCIDSLNNEYKKLL
jgi:glycosyltransferase involved in cell wall biosynthesis